MKRILTLLCFSFAVLTPLRANTTENSERLVLLKALSFTKAKSVSIAKLSASPAGSKCGTLSVTNCKRCRGNGGSWNSIYGD